MAFPPSMAVRSACSVSPKYLHITSLEAINSIEGSTFKHTPQYEMSQKRKCNQPSFEGDQLIGKSELLLQCPLIGVNYSQPSLADHLISRLVLEVTHQGCA